MDEFTLERYPHGIPSRELRTRPTPLPRRQRIRYHDSPEVIEERRQILCADVPSWLPAHRRLVEAIRTWVA